MLWLARSAPKREGRAGFYNALFECFGWLEPVLGWLAYGVESDFKMLQVAPTLHASISCKWTLRSDRSQNARTEALLLIRNRKGHIPHIAVVTGEPMPTRIASIALGTGDIDCVYHFALHELREAVRDMKDEAAIESLTMMIEGRRLRDISDLPFDLAL